MSNPPFDPNDPLAGYTPDWEKEKDPLAGYTSDWQKTAPRVLPPVVVTGPTPAKPSIEDVARRVFGRDEDDTREVSPLEKADAKAQAAKAQRVARPAMGQTAPIGRFDLPAEGVTTTSVKLRTPAHRTPRTEDAPAAGALDEAQAPTAGLRAAATNQQPLFADNASALAGGHTATGAEGLAARTMETATAPLHDPVTLAKTAGLGAAMLTPLAAPELVPVLTPLLGAQRAAVVGEAIAALGPAAMTMPSASTIIRYAKGDPSVSEGDVGAASLQIAGLALAPAVTELGTQALTPVIGAGPAAAAANIGVGTGVGATFTPDDPAVGGLLGGVAGGVLHAATREPAMAPRAPAAPAEPPSGAAVLDDILRGSPSGPAGPAGPTAPAAGPTPQRPVAPKPTPEPAAEPPVAERLAAMNDEEVLAAARAAGAQMPPELAQTLLARGLADRLAAETAQAAGVAPTPEAPKLGAKVKQPRRAPKPQPEAAPQTAPAPEAAPNAAPKAAPNAAAEESLLDRVVAETQRLSDEELQRAAQEATRARDAAKAEALTQEAQRRQQLTGLSLFQRIATGRLFKPKEKDAPAAAPAPAAVEPAEPVRSGGSSDSSPSTEGAKQEAAAPATFRTAKGSTYRVEPNGATTRDKAARPEHGNDAGPQPTSERTVYVDEAGLQALGEIQAQGGAKRRLAFTGDGRVGVQYVDGPNAGKFERRTVVAPQTQPAVGLYPVEMWNDGGTHHFGNQITEVGAGEPAAAAQPKPGAKVRVKGKKATAAPWDPSQGPKPEPASPAAVKPAGRLQPYEKLARPDLLRLLADEQALLEQTRPIAWTRFDDDEQIMRSGVRADSQTQNIRNRLEKIEAELRARGVDEDDLTEARTSAESAAELAARHETIPDDAGIHFGSDEAVFGSDERRQMGTKGKPGKPAERITSAAIRTPDGRIFEGPIHVLAVDAAREAGAITPQQASVWGGWGEDGFMTSTGRFVSREEAAAIEKAATGRDGIMPGSLDAAKDLPAETRNAVPPREVPRAASSLPRTPFDTPEIIDAREHTARTPSTHLDESPERQRLRDQWTREHYEKTVAEVPGGPQFDKQAIFLVGLTGSGKTTVAGLAAQRHFRAGMWDTDAAKALTPEYEGGRGSQIVYREAGIINRDARAHAVDQGMNLIVPTIGLDPEGFRRFAEELQAKGYTLHVRYVDVPPETAARRTVVRYLKGGHFVDPVIPMESGDKPRRTYEALRTLPGVASDAEIDNGTDGAPARVVYNRNAPELDDARADDRSGARGRRAGDRRGSRAARADLPHEGADAVTGATPERARPPRRVPLAERRAAEAAAKEQERIERGLQSRQLQAMGRRSEYKDAEEGGDPAAIEAARRKVVEAHRAIIEYAAANQIDYEPPDFWREYERPGDAAGADADPLAGYTPDWESRSGVPVDGDNVVDLFGDERRPEGAPDQTALFGADEGTERKRDLAGTERNARGELEKLNARLRAGAKLTTAERARWQTLTKLVRRNEGIGAEDAAPDPDVDAGPQSTLFERGATYRAPPGPLRDRIAHAVRIADDYTAFLGPDPKHDETKRQLEGTFRVWSRMTDDTAVDMAGDDLLRAFHASAREAARLLQRTRARDGQRNLTTPARIDATLIELLAMGEGALVAEYLRLGLRAGERGYRKADDRFNAVWQDLAHYLRPKEHEVPVGDILHRRYEVRTYGGSDVWPALLRTLEDADRELQASMLGESEDGVPLGSDEELDTEANILRGRPYRPRGLKGGGVREATAAYDLGAPEPQDAEGGVASFDSRLEQAILRGPGKATGKQWRAALTPNVAQGEREWTGVERLLADRADDVLTKSQVLDVFERGRIRLGEEVRSQEGEDDRYHELSEAHDATQSAWFVLQRAMADMGLPEGEIANWRRRIIESDDAGEAFTIAKTRSLRAVTPAEHARFIQAWDTHAAAKRELDRLSAAHDAQRPEYDGYQLPGGTNYRELLVTLEPRADDERLPTVEQAKRFLTDAYGESAEERYGYRRPRDYITKALEVGYTGPSGRAPSVFSSVHYPTDNLLLHVRVNDRTGPNGEQVLFVEEIQSDWHEQGRKEGYSNGDTPAAVRRLAHADRDAFYRGKGEMSDAEWSALSARVREWDEREARAMKAAPDAPFKKTEEWVGLALRRVMDEAVRGGYDMVAWTTGDQQNERYNLEKVADQIEYAPTTRELTASKAGGRVYRGTHDPEKLAGVIGKELAEKLLAQPLAGAGPRRHILAGRDLRVGGSGMKGFYEHIVPVAAKELGKRLGVALPVERVDLGLRSGGKFTLGEREVTIDDIEREAQNPDISGWTRLMLQDAADNYRNSHEDDELTAGDALQMALNDPQGMTAAQQETVQRDMLQLFGGTDPQSLTGQQPAVRITPEVRRAFGAKGRHLYERGVQYGERPASPSPLVSTRVPTAKGATEDPLAFPPLVIDAEAILQQPKMLAKLADVVRRYPGLAGDLRGQLDPEVVTQAFVEHAVGNLLWLHDQMPKTLRDRAKLWYTGANRIAERWAAEFGLDVAQVAGIIAVLSPQTDWFMNAERARRVLDALTHRTKQPWTPSMSTTALRILAKPEYAPYRPKLLGKRLEQLDDPVLQAMWIRVYDEAHGDRRFPIITPEGDVGDPRTTDGGAHAQLTWGSFAELAKAVAIFRDGSRENISAMLGGQHKVRSFFNNILAPDSPQGDVTIDTHAVAAALLRPLSAASSEVDHNFGKAAESAFTGARGTYGLYAEAYRVAAARRGLLPRELQSITWEAVRGLFPARFKGVRSNVEAVDALWREYDEGERSLDDTRRAVLARAGGITRPEWADRPARGVDAAARDSGDAREVSGAGVSGGRARPAAGGDRGDAPARGARGVSSVKESAPEYPAPKDGAFTEATAVEEAKRAHGSYAKALAAARALVDNAPEYARAVIRGIPTAPERQVKVRAAVGKTFVDIRGKQLVTTKQVAQALYAFRSPKQEQFHILLLDDDQRVLSHTVETSGALNYVDVGDPTRWMHDIRRRAERLGATRMIVAHNHPSGDPTPSQDDINFTLSLGWTMQRDGGPALLGQLVLDHDRASWIRPGAGSMVTDPVDIPKTGRTGRKMERWDTAGMLPRIDSPDLAAALVKAAGTPDALAVFYLDTKNQVVAYEPRLPSAIDTMPTWLPERMRALGAMSVVLGVTAHERDELRRHPVLRIINEARLEPGNGQWTASVLDVIGTNYDDRPHARFIASAGRLAYLAPVRRDEGPTRPARRLREDPDVPGAEGSDIAAARGRRDRADEARRVPPPDGVDPLRRFLDERHRPTRREREAEARRERERAPTTAEEREASRLRDRLEAITDRQLAIQRERATAEALATRQALTREEGQLDDERLDILMRLDQLPALAPATMRRRAMRAEAGGYDTAVGGWWDGLSAKDRKARILAWNDIYPSETFSPALGDEPYATIPKALQQRVGIAYVQRQYDGEPTPSFGPSRREHARSEAAGAANRQRAKLDEVSDLLNAAERTLDYQSAQAREAAERAERAERKASFRLLKEPGALYDAPLVASSLDEVEARWKAAKGVRPESWREKARAAIDAAKKLTRHFPEIDPSRSELDAVVHELLLEHERAPRWAQAAAYDALAKITEGLSAPELDLMTRALVLPDILKDVEDGLYGGKSELPFGYPDEAAVRADLEAVEDQLVIHPQVEAALERRKAFVSQLTRELVEAELLDPKVLEDSRYYHRQVLAYVGAARPGLPGGSKDVRHRGRGFQKGRTGGSDFNTAYEQAEFEWVTQALRELKTKETLDALKRMADRTGPLKALAKQTNLVRLGELLHEAEAKATTDPREPEELVADFLAPYNQAIAIAGARILRGLDDEGMPPGLRGFDDLIDELRDAQVEHEAAEADRKAMDLPSEPFVFDHKDWFKFLAALAALDGDHGATIGARMMFKAIAERTAAVKDTLGGRYIDPRSAEDLARLAPEGYVTWQPEPGNHWFRVSTLDERVLEAAIAGEHRITRDDVKEMLVQGGPRETWIIPDWLAATLTHFDPQPHAQGAIGGVDRAITKVLGTWKQWVLTNPWRVAKYNLNNMSGDVDAVVAYAPAILRGVPDAATALWHYNFRRTAPAGMTRDALEREMQEAVQLGVIDAGLSAIEIPDITEERWFRHLAEASPWHFSRLLVAYARHARELTQFRENLLRLAAFRYFLARESGKTATRFAASNPARVRAETNPRRRAALLARDLVGDYGATSAFTQVARTRFLPFFSFQEVNAKRYTRLLRNLPLEARRGGGGSGAGGAGGDGDGGMGAAARLAIVGGAKMGRTGLSLAMKVNAFFILGALWNYLFFRDEEEELRRTGRAQTHIILGRNDDGSIKTVRVEGAFADYLEWLNLHDYPEDVRDLARGTSDLGDKFVDAAKAPVAKVVGLWEPFSKLLFEQLTGKSTYPNPFRPTAIRDRGEHAARALSVDALYKRVTGKPMPPGNPIMRLFVYRTDPGEAAYYEVSALANQWLAAHDKLRSGDRPTERDNALYYWKRAAQWGDEDAAQKWRRQYIQLGGTLKSYMQSMQRGRPLGAMSGPERGAFLRSLSEHDRALVRQAMQWYARAYRPRVARAGRPEPEPIELEIAPETQP